MGMPAWRIISRVMEEAGAADGDSWQTGRRRGGDDLPGGQDHRQRAGPEQPRPDTQAAVGDMVAAVVHLDWVTDVEDQGVVLRAALGFENAGDGVAVETVGTEAVDGLRRQGDEFTVSQELCGDGCGIRRAGREKLGFHQMFVLSPPSLRCRRSAWSWVMRASMISSRSPFMMESSLYRVRPMRWSVTRPWGKL